MKYLTSSAAPGYRAQEKANGYFISHNAKLSNYSLLVIAGTGGSDDSLVYLLTACPAEQAYAFP